MKRSLLIRPGDLNAFFGLMLDNVTQLVILSGILIGVFGFPKELVFHRIIPGSVVGVLIGDLVYSTMAIRLARKTGRADVTESAAAGFLGVAGIASSFGLIHSPFPDGRLLLPWSADGSVPILFSSAYFLSAGLLMAMDRLPIHRRQEHK